MNRVFPQALAALALYALLAAALIWRGASLTHQLSGIGSDPFDSPLFLAWWPYALTHHLDPFFTKLIWYPSGVSMLWVTSVPLLSLLGWPVTAAFGAVVTYNLLIITSPMFSAWSAYFLCRHVTRNFTASLFGGFLFGFSTYETSQSIGALNLTIIFCLPLLLLVVLKRLDDELSRPAAVALAAMLLLAQFLICIEIFAMIFVFGGIAWALALAYLPEQRPVLRRLFVDGLWTAPFVALPLVPIFISMARHYALINHPAAWPYIFVTDLLSIAIPSELNLFGKLFHGVAGGGASDTQESGGYLGLPLLAMIALYLWQEGRTRRGRYCGIMVLVCLLCSLGPFLWVGGHFTGIALPWLAMVHLPLLGSALPGRFTLMTSLVVSIIAASWLALAGRRKLRLLLALLACIALLPQPHPWRPVPVTKFFAPGRVQEVLGPNPRLIILPFAINGPSSLWQLQNELGFTQVGGYLGFPPKPAQAYKATIELFGGRMGKSLNAADFAAFARGNGAQYVVAGPGEEPAELAVIETLGWPERRVDDVTIFTVPPA
ncbi:MAG TPA: hypothetical protein VEQ16_09760 [Acidocella sp.]|jgi:hypothetical protein|nr:hypothetical protein [Acidocella sp.]